MKTIVIPKQLLLPQSSVRLGRFITNVERPDQDYHDPWHTRPNTSSLNVSEFDGNIHATHDAGFRAHLTSLLSAMFSRGTQSRVHVTAEQFRQDAMNNYDEWFDEVTRLSDTRKWIEKTIQRRDIYLVVGIHTVLNASISHESAFWQSANGNAEIPVSLALTAAGFVAPPGLFSEPSVTFQQQGQNGAHIRFVASGEHVCAIEYRRLRCTWLSSKCNENFKLSGVRQWCSLVRMRNEEDGEDDIVEVSLEDVGDLDSNWDKQILDGWVVLSRSIKEP